MLTRLEQAHSLDAVGDTLQKAVMGAIRPSAVRDFLHGTWLGHPLHPVLVQMPVGAFLSAAVLDLMPGERKAATTLIAVGTAGAAPAMAAGLTDWSEMTKDRRRVGLVHAAGNTVALGLYIGSLAARLSGRTARGKALAFAGLSIAGASAYLGGHLSYSQGGGMNHAAPDVARLPEDWTAVGELAALPDGKPAVRRLDDVPILLYRQGDRVTAMIERCSHETGPLGEGDVVGSGADACVVCPWHGSTFRLTDGAVVHGPAANDQPILRCRVVAGVVEVAQP
ncbi:Rieske (2Fe-2S) protein [Jidongwangia harbinensis]|uniref:Rieske (2Fe-2S) protein n=1 Tax=Jidongwangia harbinensis TaxID=2878561 RepID=UPI001CDA13B8|nr:Rieske (2Fe-2S) protein [Jidongwangia harbinensis]MCA2212916.1 Rieske (2Fe-2S) protein [Jidongwangia harbinensis]